MNPVPATSSWFAPSLLAPGMVALLVAATSCMPLPPDSRVAVSPGILGDQWVIRWDPKLRTPLTMTNRSLEGDPGPRAGAAIPDAAAEAAVQAVFHNHWEWFRSRSDVDAIRVVRSETRRWLKLLRVEQTYRGVSVAGGGYDAHVLPGGRVGTLEGRFYPEIEIVVTPLLDSGQAESYARSWYTGIHLPASALPRFQFERQNGLREPHVLVIVPSGDRFVLAWGILVQSPPTESTRVYVDATTGVILGYQVLRGSGPR